MYETITLIGFPGAGKTTLGKKLAQEQSFPFFDTDRLLEEQHHLAVSQLWHLWGEEKFRAEEKAIVMSFCPGAQVIAAGGGVGLCEGSIAHLKKLGEVVYLKVSFCLIYERLQIRGLPAWATQANIERVFEERSLLYEKHATRILEDI
jgi:shikimate kinase